nr:myb-like protein V [Arachis hypogaea]
MDEDVVNVEVESSKQKNSSQVKKHNSEPAKMPTISHPQSNKQTPQPTKPTSQPSSQPNKPTMKPNSQPKKPTMKPNSQLTKPAHKPIQTTTQPMKTPLQPIKPHPQPKRTTSQGNAVPPQSNTPSQTANNSQDNSNKNKDGSSGCRLTRSGKYVKDPSILEEDSDSHDSYESAEDELYRPPKFLGDNLYSSDSDSDTDNKKSGTRKDIKYEVREKYRPPKTRLGDKEIETDDSSYEGSEDEQSSDSNLDEDDDDLESTSDADS